MIKPKIKYTRGVYQCSRWIKGEWIGFGKTPEQAYFRWHLQNQAPNLFNLAA